MRGSAYDAHLAYPQGCRLHVVESGATLDRERDCRGYECAGVCSGDELGILSVQADLGEMRRDIIPNPRLWFLSDEGGPDVLQMGMDVVLADGILNRGLL